MKRWLSLILTLVLAVVGSFACTDHTYAESEAFEFADLNDPALLAYLEETIYTGLIEELDSDEYFVEGVSVKYISKEYLDEVAYNSQANIFFGYTLAELDEYFQGTSYVFTLGDDGQTVVQVFEDYDDTYDKVIRNVAIGAGVIIVCVVISVATSGAGAPTAVSAIFAMSAKSGAIAAVSGGVVSGVSAGVVTGIETGDFDESMKAAALAGSEGFMWGAIGGAVTGGASEYLDLRDISLAMEIPLDDAARIQYETKLPVEFIKNFHSIEEYNVYKEAGLVPVKVNGKWAYVQDIDWDLVDEKGLTNLERVKRGYNPIDADGKSFEVHHVGQKADSPLALLTYDQHKTNNAKLHKNTGTAVSEVDHGYAWTKQKKEFFLALYEMSIK